MNIYLASSYTRRAELQGYAAELRAIGHVVTSRWLDGSHDGCNDETATDAERTEWAEDDLDDIHDSNILILFTGSKDVEPEFRPGNHPPDGFREMWMPVPGSRLGYEVSNLGQVRNSEGELVSGHLTRGYRQVRPNGKHEPEARVNRLVAGAFIGPCPQGHVVDHVDGNKANNWVGNLEYVTRATNTRRAEALGLVGDRSGERNGRSKLTWDQVADIRTRARYGETKASLGREYGVSDQLVCRIVQGRLWKPPSRAGHMVEFGFALWHCLKVLVVGPRVNVFCHLDYITHHDTWEQAKGWLAR